MQETKEATVTKAEESPPCMTARRGGCVIKNYREATKADADGVVFLSWLGKPPRPRFQRMLRGIFLIARPPLLAVMQGGDYCAFAPVAPFTRSANTVYS